MSVPDFSYPLQPPRERGLVRAILLTVLTHALLGLFLFYGIHWQNGSPAGTEAELWADVPSDLQTPVPTPVPVPVEPQQQETVSVAPSLPVQSADIALEQQRRKRQQQAAREAQLAEQRRLQHQAATQRERQLATHRAEQLKAQRQAEAQRATQQKAARAQAAARAKKLDAERRARIAQMQHGLGGGMGTSGSGLARRGTGRGSGGHSYAAYMDKVRRLVQSNTGPWAGDPHGLITYVMVRCAPDGTILSTYVTRHSSNAEWDSIALRAVRRSSPMPRDSDGKTPSSFVVRVCPLRGGDACPAG